MLFVAIAITAVVLLATVSNDQRSIQGLWQGTGGDAQYRLSFRGEMLVASVGSSPALEPVTSRFRLSQRRGEIDIQRTDGMQRGLYDLDGDVLTLSLADVNRPRPKSLTSGKNRQQRRYVFKRGAKQ